MMINYPNGKQVRNIGLQQSASHRGMNLEHDINLSNDYYRELNRAIIYKKPTPIQIVHVDYPKRTAAKIDEAYFKVPSTTDYNGIYQGRYIDFEAKETANKTSFPFSCIHPHQIRHLKQVLEHGAIAFVIVRFKYYDETFFVEAYKMIEAYLQEERRSLPYRWFKEECWLIPASLTPPIPYLRIVDQLYFKGE